MSTNTQIYCYTIIIYIIIFTSIAFFSLIFTSMLSFILLSSAFFSSDCLDSRKLSMLASSAENMSSRSSNKAELRLRERVSHYCTFFPFSYFVLVNFFLTGEEDTVYLLGEGEGSDDESLEVRADPLLSVLRSEEYPLDTTLDLLGDGKVFDFIS